MGAGARRYRALLALPGARAPVIASALGSMPIGMFALAILLLARESTGSFAEAGRIAGAFGLANALGAVAQGRLMDRLGQPRVLRAAAAGHLLALGALVLAAERAARSNPAIAVDPRSSAYAGTSTCTTPTAAPIAARTTSSVRMPGAPSGASQPPPCTTPRQRRDAGVAENASALPLPSSAATSTAAAGETSATIAATSTGAVTTETSNTTATSAYAVSRRSGSSTSAAHSARIAAGSCGRHAPPATAQAASAQDGAALSAGSLAGGVIYGARSWPGTPAARLPLLLLGLAAGFTALGALDAPVALAAMLLASGLLLAPTTVVGSTLLDTAGIGERVGMPAASRGAPNVVLDRVWPRLTDVRRDCPGQRATVAVEAGSVWRSTATSLALAGAGCV